MNRLLEDEATFIDMVTAWTHENNAVFGQVRTEDKSNEITAIP